MKLYFMQLGILRAMRAPIPGYAIQTDDGINVLVDSGYSRTRIGAYLHSEEEPVQMDEQDYVINQLARIGLSPKEIHYVICTHFDPDHSGNHDMFSEATFVVQRSHYELARQGSLPRLNMSRASWYAPDLRYHLVDGDVELLPGIQLLETSGHVPGHQAVLVRLRQTGPVLLAIDAIPMAKYLNIDPEQRVASPVDHDETTSCSAGTSKVSRPWCWR